jgi:hypothetical protein
VASSSPPVRPVSALRHPWPMTPRPWRAVLADEKPDAVTQVFIVLAFVAGAVFGIAVSFLVLAVVAGPIDTDFTGDDAPQHSTVVRVAAVS